MKFLFSILLFSIHLSFFSQEIKPSTEFKSQANQKYASCKVHTNQLGLQKLANLGIAVDHGNFIKNAYFISDFSEREIEKMRQNDFIVEILIDDVSKFYVERSKTQSETRNSTCVSQSGFEPITPSNFNLGSMAGYYTYQEYLAEIDEMASLYPNLISVKAPIDTFLTHEARPIYWLRISDNPNQDEGEAEVLYSAIHHAREPASLTTTIYYMWYLLENYATNSEIQYLVNETEMYFVPMINPDGYIQNQTSDPSGGGMWRKNKRNNGDGTYGVDLNRNYAHLWGTTGVSFDTNNDTYPGTGAFSEPETQAMKWFCENRDFSFAFNAHTYSNLLLFPIGSTINDFADDHDYFQTIGNEMTRFSNFIAEKSSTLYAASGDSDDYMYLEDLTIKPKIFAFTPEIGGDSEGFWPAEESIIPLCQDMVYTNLTLAHAPHNYWKVSETDPSTIVDLTGNFNHSVTRLGLLNDPLNVSIEALSGIQTIGTSIDYTLGLNQSQTGTISYTLNPTIVLGNEIKYVLISNFGLFTKRDTVTKTYGNPSLQYQNDAANLSDWSGDWDLTGESFASASTSFTDSPLDTYNNDSYTQFQLNQYIDLTQATIAKVQFQAKWNIENNFDYAQFQISIDSGLTWIPQCGKYTNLAVIDNGSVQPNGKPVYDGEQNDWILEEISLNDYLGQAILMRFVLEADGGVKEDGFYFDDFKVYHNGNPSTATLSEVSNTKIAVFPNPAKDKITISSSESLKNGLLKIIDQKGSIVYSEKVIYDMNEKVISTSSFQNGFYLLEFTNEKQQISRTKLLLSK